jgi:HD-like signal output (HDOD) protein
VLKIDDVIRGVTNVGTVQLIYNRLTAVMNHPLSSAADVGKVIGEDPGLTARLLRLVNSPIYGFPTRIDTVSQAISIVGMTQLHDLALGTSFIQLFSEVPADLVSMDSFWRHSVACGVTARVLAAQRREPNVERFFVAGLLHDIGRPVIYMNAGAEAREALTRCRRSGELLYKVENEIFGFHHGTVGSALLERWRLPGLLQEVTAWHHNPGLASRFPIETAVVHVADIIANALQFGTSGERLVPPLVPEAWDRIGLSPTGLPFILKQVERQFTEAVTAVLGH